MDVALFGCKDTTAHVLDWLGKRECTVTLVTLSPEKAAEQSVAGYVDLARSTIPSSVHVAERYDLSGERDADFFSSRRFDVGFAMGWQRLIPPAVLERFGAGVFGMHGSARDLPYGRGRSPMNWSIIEGRDGFVTNLFRYGAGVDDGPIVDSRRFSILDRDTAETMHFKNMLSFIDLAEAHWEEFESGRVETRPQAPGEGSYYPKREPGDGIVDWTQSIEAIDRLVRAVAPPFDGAFSFLDGAKVRFLRAAPFFLDAEPHPFADLRPGEICAAFGNGKFLVRASGGVLIVHEWDGTPADLCPGQRFDSPRSAIRRFPRNADGTYDLPPGGREE